MAINMANGGTVEDIDLTPREARRYARRAAWRFTHNRPRWRWCHKRSCWTCLWRTVTGRYRRERAVMRANFEAQRRLAEACEHEWRECQLAGRMMPHCDLCGTTRWVRS